MQFIDVATVWLAPIKGKRIQSPFSFFASRMLEYSVFFDDKFKFFLTLLRMAFKLVVTSPSSVSDNTSDGRHQWLWPAHPLDFIFIVKIYRFNTRDRVA